MKIVNSKGFSSAWVRAAEKYLSQYERLGDVSTTEVIDSPRISVLRRRHEDEIVVDIKDLMWLLLGQVVHLLLENNADENTIPEQRIIVPFDGWQVSMKADYIQIVPGTDPVEHTVQDYKITGVWAFKHGVSKSQEAQNNLYRWGYNKMAGLNCTRGQLEMFIKDWNALDAKIEHDYPEDQVVRVPVPDWPATKTEAYLTERIRAHKHARTCNDNDLPLCTLQERWGDPDRFAVKAVVNGKIAEKASPGASRLETRKDAENWIASKKDPKKQYVIEFRKGENKRCTRNACWVSQFCNQFQSSTEGAAF